MRERYNPIHSYLSYEDLLNQLGYTHRPPKVGSLGKALLTASKNHRSIKWLKHHLDSYFDKLREAKEKHLAISK